MDFLSFLTKFVFDEIDENFTINLIELPNPEDDFYHHIGSRWCSVERLLKKESDGYRLLIAYACRGKD